MQEILNNIKVTISKVREALEIVNSTWFNKIRDAINYYLDFLEELETKKEEKICCLYNARYFLN